MFPKSNCRRGDCLGVFDIRKARPELEAMSDPQEADLLCCRIVKVRNENDFILELVLFGQKGKKVICGTGDGGFISVFHWGDFGESIIIEKNELNNFEENELIEAWI